jgi:uncharacterized protein (TIGR03000 family)
MYSVVLAAVLTAGTSTPDFGCHGCYGCHGCHGCSGCYGGCSGAFYGCSGCYGGCHGCYGSSCYGCYGSSCYGCYGSSCHGCHGTIVYGCYGSCHGCCGGTVIIEKHVIVIPEKKHKKKHHRKHASAPATVVVHLPENAKLYVDNVYCPLTSAVRSFDTPELPTGRKYYYTLKAELIHDGKPVTQTHKVLIAAGSKVKVDFNGASPVSMVTEE